MQKLKTRMELAALLLFLVLFLTGMASAAVNAQTYPEEVVAEVPQVSYTATLLHDAPQPTVTPMATQTPEPTPASTPEPTAEPELLYDVPLSDELQRFVRERCEEYGVPFEIALALIGRESSYRTDVVSTTSDYGLMQINIINHEWLAEELGLTDMMDPYQNITAGCYILGKAFRNYDDTHQSLMAYNMGDRGMSEAWASGQYSTAYSRAVVEAAALLERRGE